VAEPLIIFTEYRDTLARVARSINEPVAVLHGGLSRHERAEALRAFTEGRRRILLATDAAGEGLNLHHRCRIVINLELPWNPMRLEQRIGRVDRIGQRRTVHAFHLVAAGTGEERLLTELRERIALAQSDIGAPDPLSNDATIPEEMVPQGLADISSELARLQFLRALPDTRVLSLQGALADDRPQMAFARQRPTRLRLGGRLMLIWDLEIEDGLGRPVATLVAGALARLTWPSNPSELRTIISQATSDLSRHIVLACDEERLRIAEARRAFVEIRLTRERAIRVSVDARPLMGVQPGLFDGRAACAQAAGQAALAEMSEAIAQRAARLESIARIETASRPRLRLVLLP
jgi:hypothetical protein